jgi:hypothetical protein
VVQVKEKVVLGSLPNRHHHHLMPTLYHQFHQHPAMKLVVMDPAGVTLQHLT